jgi:hypothetical protein
VPYSCAAALLGSAASPGDIARLGADWRAALGELFPDVVAASATAARRRAHRGGAGMRLAFEAVAELVRRMAEREPLLISVDDAQWLDSDSGLLLAYLMRRLQDLPVLFLIATRAEAALPFPEQWRKAFGEPEAVRMLTLASISANAVAELCSWHAARSGTPLGETVPEVLFRTAGGHPFFTWELLTTQRGGAVGLPGAADLAGGAVTTRGIEEHVRARIAALTPVARHALRCLAVLGPGGWAAEWRQVAGLAASRLSRVHGELLGAGLTHDSPAGTAIRHDIVREVQYALIPEHERRRLHARVLEHVLSPGSNQEQVAFHLLRSGRRREAHSAALATALQAREAGEWGRAEVLAGLALEAADTPAAARGARWQRAEALFQLRRWTASATEFARLEEECATAGEHERQVDAAYFAVRIRQKQGEAASSLLKPIEAVLRMAEGFEHRIGQIRLAGLLTLCAFDAGEFEVAHGAASQVSRLVAGQEITLEMLEMVSVTAGLLSVLKAADSGETMELAVSVAEGMGQPAGLLDALVSRSLLHAFEGKPELAQRDAIRALRIASTHGVVSHAMNCMNIVAVIRMDAGDVEEAAVQLEAAMDLGARSAVEYPSLAVIGNYVVCLCSLGRAAEAVPRARLLVNGEPRSWWGGITYSMAVGTAALEGGALGKARAAAEAIKAVLDTRERWPGDISYAVAFCARVHVAGGEVGEALAVLRRGREMLRDGYVAARLRVAAEEIALRVRLGEPVDRADAAHVRQEAAARGYAAIVARVDGALAAV